MKIQTRRIFVDTAHWGRALGNNLELHQYYNHVLSLVPVLVSVDIMHETVAAPSSHESLHESPYDSVFDSFNRLGSKPQASVSVADPSSSPREYIPEVVNETRILVSVDSVHTDSHRYNNENTEDLYNSVMIQTPKVLSKLEVHWKGS